MERGVRRVTVVKSKDGDRKVYRSRDEDVEERNPIKRVTLVKRDNRGRIVARESYSSKRRSKRSSRGLRPIERGIRNILEFQVDVLGNYLGRHRRSNQKRRDGWLRDMQTNVFRAVKKSRPRRLFRMSRYTRDRD
jgi:hypothetical protein